VTVHLTAMHRSWQEANSNHIYMPEWLD